MPLFPFQEEAVKKFLGVRNCLLGDDMGLGKTVTAIELDRRRRLSETYYNKRTRASMKTLVVTLKSLVGSWEKHFKEWNPEVVVCTIDPKNRTAFVASVLSGSADVYICHWEAVRLIDDLRKVKWFHIVADETHRIKNRKAQLTQAFKKLSAEYKLDMSGTWVDNSPQDAWSTLNHLYPKVWSSYWQFFNHHVLFRERVNPNGNRYREIIGVHDAEGLHAQMEKFYVRRRKEDVLKDLPDKYYTQIEVDLTPQQRRAYEQMKNDMLAWVGKHESEPIAAPVVIAQLTRLQQFAVAYAQLETTKRAKWVPAKEWWLDLHPEIPRREGENGPEGFVEQIVQNLVLAEPSSKLDVVMELLEGNDEHFVIFSQSKQVARLLNARLQAAKISHVLLTGDTPAVARTRVVEEFQRGDHRVFIGTIAAGGVGLTLTRASTVIFLDRAWSPSVNRQAEDRLHRIGQKRAVQVIDLVARDTVDRGRLQQIELKWSWVRRMLGDL